MSIYSKYGHIGSQGGESPRSLHFKMNAFIFLQGVDATEEVIGGGVAAGTKHTRPALNLITPLFYMDGQDEQDKSVKANIL